jgi:hypothetical protein
LAVQDEKDEAAEVEFPVAIHAKNRKFVPLPKSRGSPARHRVPQAQSQRKVMQQLTVEIERRSSRSAASLTVNQKYLSMAEQKAIQGKKFRIGKPEPDGPTNPHARRMEIIPLSHDSTLTIANEHAWKGIVGEDYILDAKAETISSLSILSSPSSTARSLLKETPYRSSAVSARVPAKTSTGFTVIRMCGADEEDEDEPRHNSDEDGDSGSLSGQDEDIPARPKDILVARRGRGAGARSRSRRVSGGVGRRGQR